MISADGGLPAHRYTPQVTQRWPRGSEPASAHRPFRVPHQPAEGDREAGGEGDDDGAVVVVVHGGDGAPTVWQIANGG